MKEQFHFCKFIVDKVTFEQNEVRNMPNGFLSPKLAYICAGECNCVSREGKLQLKAGDIWSLPAKSEYKSIWIANPKVEFYFIEYEADFISFFIKHFKKIENCDLGKEFKSLYDSNNEFERIALFYKIISKLYHLIVEDDNVKIDNILPALKFIRDNYDKQIKVKELAHLCFMCESKFFSEFKQITGFTPINYKNHFKIERATEMILHNITLEEICATLNYSSPAFLRRQIKKAFGLTPIELKKQYNKL